MRKKDVVMSKNHKGRGVNQKKTPKEKREERKRKKTPTTAKTKEKDGKQKKKRRSKSEKPCDVIDKSFDEGKERQKGT